MNCKIIDVAKSEEEQIGQFYFFFRKNRTNLYYEYFPLRTFHQTLIWNC